MKPVEADVKVNPTTNSGAEVSRRDFFALTGPGLLVLFSTEPAEARQEPQRLPPPSGFPSDFNAYLHIGGDGRVTCLIGKIEMGQGAMTSSAELLAEELDVAFDAVDVVMGDTERCPWDMGTFGSLSTRMYGQILRKAGAEARAVLLQMAAEQLKAPVERLKVQAGVVTDPTTGKKVTYAQLVEGKRIERHLDKVPVKTVAELRLVGHSVARKDSVEKVTGKAQYAGDIILPGMLCARILRPPAHGAKLKSADTAAAEKSGARVVKDGEMIAVLHERRDLAERALELIKAEWDRPAAAVDDVSIFEHLIKKGTHPAVVHENGSLAEGEKQAAHIIEETYLNSYVAHSAMETHSAVANFENGKLTVWASTQTPFPLQGELAGALGLPHQKVRVIPPYLGGGFGGKSANQQAIEAAHLAKLTGKPVQVVWSREEEFFFDTFRPAAVVKIRAGLSGAGKMVLWDFLTYGGGDREAKQYYDIPHQRTRSAGGWGGGPDGMHPLAVGAWRAPSVNTNTFARESHIDMLARKAGVDAVEFRLKHLSDKRTRGTLEAAANRFGWSTRKKSSGVGFGVACGTDVGGWATTMAEVEVDRSTGKIRVRRIVAAMDIGLIVNPDGALQQLEGGITMGLGYTLSEEVHFKGGDVLDRNYDSYELPRFSWLPKIETVLVDNRETPSQGCGEPPIITIGALIANAVFDATGVRMLQLPMTPTRVKAALSRG
ncbi:MAG: molybdopterin cofactor-binding domain-containing protein [Bryobacteraceae bacterium]|jgi:isoquinoline 1-oxidoreductase